MPDPWSVRHGDSWSSPALAVLDADGGTFSVSGWTISAQARQAPASREVFFSWSSSRVTVGTATVKKSDGTEVDTAAIELHLDPTDFVTLPLRWVGQIEVSIEKDTRVHTILPARRFEIFPDLCR